MTWLVQRLLREAGRTLAASFAALCLAAPAASAMRTIQRDAWLDYLDPLTGRQASVWSNEVKAEVPTAPATIRFFTDRTFARQAKATSVGASLFLQADAAACNADPLVAETATVAVQSWTTGTTQTVTVVETAPNSGLFRTASPTPQGPSLRSVAASSTGIADDTLTASLAGCGLAPSEVKADILVDPSGVVFNRLRNTPIRGVWVTLIDVAGTTNGGLTNDPAVIYDHDGVTRSPSTVQTDAEGRFSFGLVPAGWYRIEVGVPRQYERSPSTAMLEMPTGRRIAVDASFGQQFESTADMGAVRFDVPLDPRPMGLSVQKTVSRTAAEVAESVDYTLVTKNVGQVDLDDVVLHDTLPVGFAYVPGSTRVDGRPAADPAGVPGRVLRFDAGPFASGKGRTVQYRTVLRSTALRGDGINRVVARATSPEVVESQEASATVTVLPGVFTEDTTVLGTVFADCDADGLKGADEPGVPGVRLLMEDGTSVVTDGQGRYSLYGISPKTHVLKIDRTTLPAGAEPLATSQRHAGDGSSRFVDPRKSELQRADFALGGCGPALREAIAARSGVSATDRELRLSLRTDLALTRAASPDVKALPASGTVGDLGPAAAAPAASSASAPVADRAAPQGLAILGLADGDVLPGKPLSLRVQSRAGAPAKLLLNGVAVGEDRIGERSVDPARDTETREYVGLVLPAGATTLTLVQSDPFGNERERREVHVKVAGALATVNLSVALPKAPADGETFVPVTLSLTDRDGLPVAERHPVTLDTTIGDWDVLDLDPVRPGVQTFVDGPSATFRLRAPASAGRADLQAAVGLFTATARADFTAPLRPMVMAGIVEGVLNFRKLESKSVVPALPGDGFEQELRTYATSGDTTLDGRAAVFLKGKVLGEHLLTLGYDSDKDSRQRLFRDIQPDTFYPVYGDDAVKGFDAQSTSRLYVKLEKDKSSLLYGDFTTQAPVPARQLGSYQRSLTGLRQHLETDRVTANLFASRDSARQAVVELPAVGTSGPFVLGNGRALANSERVEVIVRDRNQPAVVLSVTPKVRFADYDFEPLSGSLLFHAPIPSVDANLNPVSIRVTYEVEQDGEKFLVAGGDVQYAVTDTVEVGAAAVRDLNPLQAQTLSSVNGTWRAGPRTTVVAEAAQLHRDDLGTGGAQRVEVTHQDPAGLQLRAFAGRSDLGFTNPSSSLAAGRREAGLKASQPIDTRTRLTADVLSSGDEAGHTRRDGLLAGVEHSFGQGSKVEAGVRWVEDHPLLGAKANDTRSVRVKAGTLVPGLPKVSVYGEAEQDVTDSDKRLLAVGGEYQLPNQGRVYARHEIISSLGGPFLLDPTQRRNTTVIGVDGDVMTDGRLFGEYRGRDAFGDRETEAAIGLRNRWRLAEGLRLNTSFERVSALSGPATNDSVALTGAIEYTANPLWKGTARLEARHATAGDTFLSTLGLARKLDADWTALAKNTYATAHTDGQPTRIQERFQMGMAYRDTATNRANGLGRYEFRRDSGLAAGDLARRVHVVSTHADWQAARHTTLTGMFAAKWVQETGAGLALSHRAQMTTLRAGQDLGDRWDLGVALRLLTDGTFSNRQQGAGVEAGHRVQDQTWVSVGWNASGFRDRDLSEDRSTQRGAYVRLRMKFDESLLGGVSL